MVEISRCHNSRICVSRDRSKQTRVVRLIRDLAHRNCLCKEYEKDAAVEEANYREVSAVGRNPVNVILYFDLMDGFPFLERSHYLRESLNLPSWFPTHEICLCQAICLRRTRRTIHKQPQRLPRENEGTERDIEDVSDWDSVDSTKVIFNFRRKRKSISRDVYMILFTR